MDGILDDLQDLAKQQLRRTGGPRPRSPDLVAASKRIIPFSIVKHTMQFLFKARPDLGGLGAGNLPASQADHGDDVDDGGGGDGPGSSGDGSGRTSPGAADPEGTGSDAAEDPRASVNFPMLTPEMGLPNCPEHSGRQLTGGRPRTVSDPGPSREGKQLLDSDESAAVWQQFGKAGGKKLFWDKFTPTNDCALVELLKRFQGPLHDPLPPFTASYEATGGQEKTSSSSWLGPALFALTEKRRLETFREDEKRAELAGLEDLALALEEGANYPKVEGPGGTSSRVRGHFVSGINSSSMTCCRSCCKTRPP